MKGQITSIEVITTLIVLFVALSILFPVFSYTDDWQKATLILKERDVLRTLDNLGQQNLYTTAINSGLMNSFLVKTIPEKNIIYWSETENLVKPVLSVACDCTNEQIAALISYSQNLQVNGRNVSILPCLTTLEVVNPCLSESDVLLIWAGGYRDLSLYHTQLQNYLATGSGIVEIMDLTNNPLDITQKTVFGIDRCNSVFGVNCGQSNPSLETNFLTPTVPATAPANFSYKYFYHLPLALRTPNSESTIPGGSPACSSPNINSGGITFKSTTYKFWICNGNSVYFDTDGDGNSNIRKIPGETVTIDSFNFLLNYIRDNEQIGLSFRPTYRFTDFLEPLSGNTRVYPIDKNDANRILLHRGFYSGNSVPVPVAIVGGTATRTAWVADFSRNGLNTVNDDHKLLLLSLLYAVSNRNPVPVTSQSFPSGYETSYIDVTNQDMYEVYKVNLGLSYPN